MTGRWTVLPLLRTTTEFLAERGIPEPRRSAEFLLASILESPRLDLYLNYDRPLSDEEVEAYRAHVRRRLRLEPIQYITEKAGFRGLELHVDPRVLIPRPETELLVGEVASWARAEAERGRAPESGWRVIDLGTGSGAIACSLALELDPVAWILGTDRSSEAIAVAAENGVLVGADRTRWVVTDGLAGLDPDLRVDALVANPPYLADGDRPTLHRQVTEWEPAGALFAGPRGDEALARVVAEAQGYLRSDGLLAFEIGAGQANRARELVAATEGLEYLVTYRDYAGLERGVLALAKG